MDFDQIFIFVYCILMTLSVTLSEECIKVDDCSCKTSKGTVDLHKVPKSVLSVVGGDYRYEYQPCEGLTEKCGETVTGTVAVCQRSQTSTVSYDVGDIKSVGFSGDPEKNLQATYTASERTSIFNIKCDKSSPGRLTSVNESPVNTYNFEFHTLYACYGSSGGNTPSSKKISTGSVLLIIFFVFLGTYFIAGMLFLKFARGAQGTEMVPNYDFWTSLPGYIKDGFTFTCRGCKTESSYSQI